MIYFSSSSSPIIVYSQQAFFPEETVIEFVLKRKLTHINNKKHSLCVSIFQMHFHCDQNSKDRNSKFQLLPSRLIYYTIIFVYDTGRIAK